MKIVFFEVPEAYEDYFKKALVDEDASFYCEKLSKEDVNLAKDADMVCNFTNSLITKEIIDLLPNLKFIVTRSTGFDHIDVGYAKSKGIKISNVPAYGSVTVAEFTFALLLTLSRKIREGSRALKEVGTFFVPKDTQGFDLEGKVLGVVGTGKIGKNVVKFAKAFGMKVLAYDLHPDLEFAQKNDFEYKTLSEVLSMSDVVTLHTPYTKDNHHFMNQENISKMKKGACLINTARGELVDTVALTSSLQDGSLGGAGLDVLEGERGFKKGDIDLLLEMPNVVVTPHIAFNTKEAEKRIMDTTLENIKGFVSGTPVNLVE